jgi:uncharacterized protein YjaZ
MKSRKTKHRRVINDYYYLYRIPKDKREAVNRAVSKGLQLARQHSGMWLPLTLKARLLKSKEQEHIKELFAGFQRGKRTIEIQITKKLLLLKNFSKLLSGTAVHEYIHLLRRGRGKAKTVLERAIEEGISCYLQTLLVGAPKYLDIKTLNEQMVKTCWRKLEAILDMPMRRYPKIWKDQVYREIYYRLGFGIVRRFMNNHPKINERELILIPRKKLVKFARYVYKSSQKGWPAKN